jgi:hypothetical protein
MQRGNRLIARESGDIQQNILKHIYCVTRYPDVQQEWSLAQSI